jgi:hypothetical protein
MQTRRAFARNRRAGVRDRRAGSASKVIARVSAIVGALVCGASTQASFHLVIAVARHAIAAVVSSTRDTANALIVPPSMTLTEPRSLPESVSSAVNILFCAPTSAT